MKRGRAIVLVVLLAVIAFAAFLALRPREPLYQGRSFRAWLADLDAKPNEQRERAKEALHQIGSNAVPALMNIMRTKDSTLKRIVAKWVNGQSVIPLHITTDVQWKLKAWPGCQIIGSALIPKLTEYLNNGESAKEAAELLYFVEMRAPESISVLGNALTNRDSRVRLAAVGALRSIQRDVWARKNVGALAIDAPDAGAAVPALLKALNDSNAEVRNAVIGALLQIDPKAAAKAGVK
jgi:hypothetical protein